MNDNIKNNFIKLKIILLNEKNTIINKYKIKAIDTLLKVLENFPKKITLNNVNELKNFKGIGDKTIKKITDILIYGEIKSDLVININILNELKDIIGIGEHNAIKLFNLGITSIEDLKQKINNKELKVNKVIELGVKYYNKYFENIPRKEIDSINILFKKIIEDINKVSNRDYIYIICGSYRRNNEYSNDIDILISECGNDSNKDINHLKYIIDILKSPIRFNNNKQLLIDDLTYKNITTKYSGFLKYKNNYIRRIDIRYVKYKYYYSALLYFTGSARLNKLMRDNAKKCGYILSEYGLKNISTGKYLKNIHSEKDIFNILNMPYLSPSKRNINI